MFLFYPKVMSGTIIKNQINIDRYCDCIGLTKYDPNGAYPYPNICYGIIYDCKYKDIEYLIKGKYYNKQGIKNWGTGCYILDRYNITREISCIYPDHNNYIEDLNNKTIEIRGIMKPPLKVPEDYEGNTAGDYWPAHIEILSYKIN